MKRFLIVFFLAAPLSAGVTYKFQSNTTGMRQATLAGIVSVEGGSVRMDLATGDNLLFKDNTIVLSSDGGKTLTVIDPAAKTYYAVSLSDLVGGAGAMLNGSGGQFKLAFQNPKVSVRDLGPAEPLSGYPTQHSVVDAGYDIAIDAMGQKMTSHMTMTTESWTTDRLNSEFTNFLQMKNLRTGFDQLDKLIEAQSGGIQGRFPLKQVTVLHVHQGENDMSATTTSEVSNIEKKQIAASYFAMPAGYTKVDDPITRMMKNLK